MEEQPRKLEHVIKVSHVCLNRDQPHLDSKSEKYLEQVTVGLFFNPSLVSTCILQAQELVSNENILLQTLGFDVAIDHPHTHVVKCCQLVKGPLFFYLFSLILPTKCRFNLWSQSLL